MSVILSTGDWVSLVPCPFQGVGISGTRSLPGHVDMSGVGMSNHPHPSSWNLGYHEIWSASGQYAFYYNAILLKLGRLCQISQVLKIPVVSKEATCSFHGLMLLVSNVNSYWWSFFPLTNLTKSSSLQNGKTQTAQLFLILEGDKNLTRSIVLDFRRGQEPHTFNCS